MGHDGHGEGCFGRTAGHYDIEQRLEEVHHAKGGHLAGLRQRTCESVKEGVNYLSIPENEDDTGSETNHERRRENVFAPFEEQLGDIVGTLAVNDAGQDTHSKEECRDFSNIPPPGKYADDKCHDGEEEEYQNEAVSGLQPAVVGGLLARPPVVVELVHRAAFGSEFHPVGIPQHEGNANHRQHHPAEEAVLQPREERQTGNTLCNTYGKGVQHGTCKPHMRSHIAHTHSHDGVEAHLDGQRDEYHHEGDGLLAHAKDGAKETEHQHYQCDDDILHPQLAYPFVTAQTLHPPQEGHDADVDGVAVVEYPEGAAHHEDEDDDVGLVDKAIEKCREDLPGLRRRFDAVEGSVDHHFAPVDLLPQELARRHHPRHHSRQHDEGEDDGKGMGDFLQVGSC